MIIRKAVPFTDSAGKTGAELVNEAAFFVSDVMFKKR
jgi:hypothetical protein